MAKKKLDKKTKKLIVSVVLVVAIIATICAVAFKPEEKIQVETVSATVETIKETLDTSGTVNAVSQDVFSIPSGVRILSLNVKEGDMVESGDVIATFDVTSLDAAIKDKENAYKKAATAYADAQTAANQSAAKIEQVKDQIAELEAEIARLQNKVSPNNNSSSAPQVSVSDDMIERFIKTAGLFGVDYSEDQAREFLSKLLSSGSTTNDLSSFIENLITINGSGNSFDFSALSGMTQSSELMSAEMSLIQLKAQLATLELQADPTYLSTFKTVADKAKESYLTAKAQIDAMRNGWVAQKKGIVTEVNISEDGTVIGNGQSMNVDVNTILSALSSGSDVTSLLSAFVGQGQVAVRVLYYPLVADISLSKYDILDVDLNQDVIIKPTSGNELSGRVSYISAVASSSNGLNIGSLMGSSSASSVIPAQVTIENADSSVIVGVDVQVSIITEVIDDALVVPVEVICIDGEDIFVYVLEDGKAVKKNVELGISSDTHYQILSGITVDDVLIKNTMGLDEGASVEVK